MHGFKTCKGRFSLQKPNFFPIGERFGFFIFFGKQNESLASIEKRPRPYHKKARQTTVRVPEGGKDTNMKYDERACVHKDDMADILQKMMEQHEFP